MSVEKSGSNPMKQALQIIREIINSDHQKNIPEATILEEKIRSLQSLIHKLWLSDDSGRIMLDCLNVLYDVIAVNGENFSPAVWKVFAIVDEKNISGIVKSFLNNPKPRLENMLCAIIDGLCQCEPQTPALQMWALYFIDGLEERENYSVLMAVSQSVIRKLLQYFFIPHFRTLIYPIFERLLYPMVSPHVFHEIIDRIPEVVAALEKEKDDENTLACLYCFSGLIKTLMARFPATPRNQDKYEILKIALRKMPNIILELRTGGLWNPKQKINSKLANILECPVCYHRLVTPVTTCQKGHCVCNDCKDKLVNCPLCRAPLTYDGTTLINQIIEMTKFPCRNSEFGCDVELVYGEIEAHEPECEYRKVSCELQVYQSPAAVESDCGWEVVLAKWNDHVEKYHENHMCEFELNEEKKCVLKHEKKNRIRILKDGNRKLYFMERIYMTEEQLFFSYHYMGRNAEAKNYIYTVKIGGKEIPNMIKYRNFCLPNYAKFDNTMARERCLVVDLKKLFHGQPTEFEYCVMMEVFGIYRLRSKAVRQVTTPTVTDANSVKS